MSRVKTLAALLSVAVLAATASACSQIDPTVEAAPTQVSATAPAPSTTTTTTVDPAAVDTYLQALKTADEQAAAAYVYTVVTDYLVALQTAQAKVTYSAPTRHVPTYSAPKVTGGGNGAPGGFLACVRNRESRGNYSVVNSSSGAGGAYQFLQSTWTAIGGRGRPQDASPAEQDAMAAKLYAQQGRAPWAGPGC